MGKQLGPSPWLMITQDMVDRFADLTGDHQWIHVDPKRAEFESPGGRTIAHGYLTLSLLPTLQAQLLRFEGFERVLNYGLERLRYPLAVETGRRIQLVQTVSSVNRLREGVFRLTLDSLIMVEGQSRPALTAAIVAQIYAKAQT
ncbi:MAG: MaoC family dehydratase [Hyphomonadaceae bacterium]